MSVIDIQWRLDSIHREALDISQLLTRRRPAQAAKFAKMAEFAANFSSYLRTHGELPPDPTSKETPIVVTSNIRRLKP